MQQRKALLDTLAASHDCEFFLADLQDVGPLGGLERDGAHVFKVPPERRAQIHIDRHEHARIVRRLHCVALRGGANRLAQKQAADMQDARGANDVRPNLVRRIGQFSAPVAIKNKLALAVRRDRNYRERGVSLPRGQHSLGRDSVSGERRDQQPAKCLIPDLAQHRRTATEARDADRHVPRRAARLGGEADFADPARRHKIDDQLAEGDNVIEERNRHRASSSRPGYRGISHSATKRRNDKDPRGGKGLRASNWIAAPVLFSNDDRASPYCHALRPTMR